MKINISKDNWKSVTLLVVIAKTLIAFGVYAVVTFQDIHDLTVSNWEKQEKVNAQMRKEIESVKRGIWMLNARSELNKEVTESSKIRIKKLREELRLIDKYLEDKARSEKRSP